MGREESSILFQKTESEIYRNSLWNDSPKNRLSLQTNMFVDNVDLNDMTPYSGRYFTRAES